MISKAQAELDEAAEIGKRGGRKGRYERESRREADAEDSNYKGAFGGEADRFSLYHGGELQPQLLSLKLHRGQGFPSKTPRNWRRIQSNSRQ